MQQPTCLLQYEIAISVQADKSEPEFEVEEYRKPVDSDETSTA